MKGNWTSILPFGIFVLVCALCGTLGGGFSRIPMTVAFLAATASALCLGWRRQTLDERLGVLARGMGEPDIMVMCLVFILAGAFAAVARDAGAVDAAVRLAQCCIPPRFMVAGVFLVSALISLAVGTSCGTIAAVAPIALAFSNVLSLSPCLLAGTTISGAMFGDNLSMISDTTIAATRTLGVAMKDKFIANAAIALPAAAIAFALYAWLGANAKPAALDVAPSWLDAMLVAPYVLVLCAALLGVNVAATLFLGAVLSAATGVAAGTLGVEAALESAGKGTLAMSETLVVALLAGGLFALVRNAGGIELATRLFSRFVRGGASCQAGAFLFTGTVNLFTANNTVAIVIAGPVVREMGVEAGANPVRLAGIVDIASCVVQGAIPYGAQMLIAFGCARELGFTLPAGELVASLYYAPVLAVCAALRIATARKPRRALKA